MLKGLIKKTVSLLLHCLQFLEMIRGYKMLFEFTLINWGLMVN